MPSVTGKGAERRVAEPGSARATALAGMGRLRTLRGRFDREPRAAGAACAFVIVVKSVGPVVTACRQRFDRDAAAGMPPHITVFYPHQYDRSIGEAVGAALADHDPFRFELVALGRFPDVVYLQPEPREPFVRLTQALSACLGAPPYGGRFQTVVPHLTVATRRWLPRSVTRTLVRALPIAGEATSVEVLSDAGGQWSILDSLPLGGSRLPDGPRGASRLPPTS